MRLSPRELTVIVLGSVILLATVVWIWVVEPLKNHLDVLDRGLAYNQDRYRQLLTLANTREQLQKELTGIEQSLKHQGEFSILSYLESLADRTGVRRHIIQMKPRPGQTTRYYKENEVEIRMEKVALSLLLPYLYEVENAPELMRVKELRMKPRFDNPNLIDVRFVVASYEPAPAVP